MIFEYKLILQQQKEKSDYKCLSSLKPRLDTTSQISESAWILESRLTMTQLLKDDHLR